jgi:hypothetical protein
MTNRLALAALAATLTVAAPRVATAQGTMTPAAFHDAMRKLWEDHITWTRLFIISAAHNLPDKDATTARLLQNQSDLGNAIRPFYGDAAGDKLTALLTDHILIAAQLVGAAKAGDNAAAGAASAKWHANADSLAAFLSGANPQHWPLTTLQTALRAHLAMTLREAEGRLTGNYAADIQAYEDGHHHMLMVADVLSKGIIAQFPRKFTTAD